MTPAPGQPDEVVLAARLGAGLRVVLTLAGVALAGLVIWDLRPAFATLSPATAVFGVIAAGAVALGAVLVLAGLFGESIELRLQGGGLRLSRANAFRRSVRQILPREVAGIGIVSESWSDGPRTHAVEIRLRRGRPVRSPGYEDRAAAEALEARLRAALTGS